MTTQSNTVKRGFEFKEAFHRLPSNMLKAVRLEIIDQLGWKQSTFRSKINGTRNLKKPERTILTGIFGSFGIEF